MLHETEHFFPCPYCGAEISMLLDLWAGSQSYIEDCEVCCNPIEVSVAVRFEDRGPVGTLERFEARSIEQ